MTKLLRFQLIPEDPSQRRVGRVHPDGSVTFRGRRYPTLSAVPPECCGLRPDVATHRQWRSLYAAIDPRRRRRGGTADGS